MTRLVFNIFIFISLTRFAYAQPAERVYSRAEYIERFKDEAIKEMKRAGIPASITIAQGILESADGNSPLAKYANNHFGIKCHNWTGPTFIQDDDTKNECFRKYKDPFQSFEDHSKFLTTRPRYAALFKLKPTDYVAWAHGLKQAGYATNPKYPQLLIKIIEDNALHRLDQQYELNPSKTIEIKQPQMSLASKPQGATRILTINKVKCISALKGETIESIAQKMEMRPEQLMKYNELEANHTIAEGDIIYIQPKRRKAIQDTHTVVFGDTPWSIAQRYGIKLERVCYYNSITKYSTLEVGSTLKLKR